MHKNFQKTIIVFDKSSKEWNNKFMAKMDKEDLKYVIKRSKKLFKGGRYCIRVRW